MKDGTKTLDEIRREVERAQAHAEDKEFQWICEYGAALISYETRHRGVTLRDRYGLGGDDCDVSKRVENDGIDIYEFDIDARSQRVKCTARALRHLRSLEKKIEYWHAKYVMCEDALNELY